MTTTKIDTEAHNIQEKYREAQEINQSSHKQSRQYDSITTTTKATDYDVYKRLGHSVLGSLVAFSISLPTSWQITHTV